MKKIVSLFVIIILCVALASCGNEETEKTTVLEKELLGGKITMAFTHKGDRVLKLHQTQTIPYSAYGSTDKEAIKLLVEQEMEGLSEYNGYKYSFELGDEDFTETVDIDFAVLDPEEAKSIPGLQFTGDLDQGISLEKTMKEFTSEGFTKFKK
ncbi:DUF1307 domain-containing protein [Eubacteriales bacterium KG127]